MSRACSFSNVWSGSRANREKWMQEGKHCLEGKILRREQNFEGDVGFLLFQRCTENRDYRIE